MSNGTTSALSQSQHNYQTKENYVTVLAIHDDPVPADGIVEITNLEKPPSNGLKVSTETDNNQIHKSIVSITRSPDTRSSVNIPKSHSEMSSLLSRTQARKSRFTDAFLDAQERLEAQTSQFELPSVSGSRCKAFVVTLPPETVGLSIGVEISTIPDPNDHRGVKLLAVEVRQIDEDGRIAEEGTIKVGDLITIINNRPVYQMSLAKAQAHLRDLQSILNPQLVINRRLKSPRMEKERSTSAVRSVAADLQIANTNKLGDTLTIKLEKKAGGFGFGVKSRVNAKNERLIYINRVMPSGPAHNVLKIGDRLLNINDVDVISNTQNEVVQLLKNIPIGGIAELRISRLVDEHESKDEQKDVVDNKKEDEPSSSLDVCHKRRQSAFIDVNDDDVEYFTFDVALQSSKSAGLGISLKGGKLYPEKGTIDNSIDCGLYVNGILHGSAAYKDGRFRENDRLIGVEAVDLQKYQHNADALAAFSKALAGVNSNVVRIHIARNKDPQKIMTFNSKDVPNVVQITKSSSDDEISIVSEALPDPETFNRENPNRKSISEKRPGVGNEAIHTQTYQKIIHQRQTSAPQIRTEILPIPEFKKQASLTYAKKKELKVVPIKIGDENEAPLLDVKPNKRSSISQFFSNLRVGSKKDKTRRQTVVIAEAVDYGQKPRSQSHDPRLLAKEKKMVHEVVADEKPESTNGKRKKKIEPAPSFKQAMNNNVSNPFFDAFIASSINTERFSNLKIKTDDKHHNRKSLGNSLPRQKKEHRGDPPPYSGPHRLTSTQNNLFEHQRIHSAHEFFNELPSINKPPVPPRKSMQSKDYGFLNMQIPADISTNNIDTREIRTQTIASSNTQKGSEITDPTCTIYTTPPRPMSLRRHFNNSMKTSTNDNYTNSNNVNEWQKEIVGPPPITAPILRKPPPIPPRIITTYSTRGFPKVQNNNNLETQIMSIEGKKQKYQDHPSHQLKIDRHNYAVRNSNPQREINTLPPPLMPRTKSSGRPRLDNEFNNRKSLVLLHRVPSPPSPLHIIPTTADYKLVEPNSEFIRSTNKETIVKGTTQKSQNRNSFISWVKGRKSVDNGDSRSSRRRLRAPSAIFYDPDEHPVNC